MKKLVIAMMLLSTATIFAQEIRNRVTQVEFQGEVWQVAASETMYDIDWIQDSEDMMDMCALQILDSKSDLEGKYHYLHEDAISTLSEQPILAIPFLSCGIGYNYYQMFESNEDFLLFERYYPGDTGLQKKVIVLNRVS